MRLLKIHRLKAKTIMRLADQLSFSCLLIGTTMLPAGATSDGATVWTKASEIMQDVYSQIVSISTITAIVCASVALLLMNFSKNGRTVDDSRAWLKRIVITWAILNGLGFIMAYITPFFACNGNLRRHCGLAGNTDHESAGSPFLFGSGRPGL